ncbi:MAG: hypothetical protein HQK58_06835 [Deltaproteobacteria bacterium]|nr:hypothetical protein [Deltaproteobacteria bacterium]
MEREDLKQAQWAAKEQAVTKIMTAVEEAKAAGVENPERIALETIKAAIDYQQFKTDNSFM